MMQLIFVFSTFLFVQNHKRHVKPLFSTDDAPENGKEIPQLGIPCLPPIGDSSFDNNDVRSVGEKSILLGGPSQKVGKVGGNRFQLQYTCNICETRNSVKVSRMAYRKGVVIAICKGCDCKHLIADNLGWTDYKGGFEGSTNNIEDFMEKNGRSREINRVSPEVFDLESKYYYDENEEEKGVVGFD